MKVFFYFNDYKQQNETGTFIFFEEAKKYVKNLKATDISISVTFESSLNADSFSSNIEKYSLEREVIALQEKKKRSISKSRFRIGSYLKKILKFFYLKVEIDHPDRSSDYNHYLSLKTTAFENLVKREKIDLVVYLHYFYFPSLHIPYILFAWDFAHRNIVGHLEFLNEFDWRERIFREALDKAYKVVTCNQAGKTELIDTLKFQRSEFPSFPFRIPWYLQANGILARKTQNTLHFSTGWFWAHKNHIVLIKALHHLVHVRGLEISLVLVGNDRGNLGTSKPSDSIQPESNVRNLGFVDEKLFGSYTEMPRCSFPILIRTQ